MMCVECGTKLRSTAKYGYCEKHSYIRKRVKRTKFCTECQKPLKNINQTLLCTDHYLKKWEIENRGPGGKKHAQKLSYLKKYYSENRLELNKKNKEWHVANKEHLRQYEKMRNTRDSDKRRTLKRNIERVRLKNDPQFRLSKELRGIVRRVLFGKVLSKRAIHYTGCNRAMLRFYIESKFKERMSWENYGEWQIDHIIPVPQFDLTDKGQFRKANHFSNLQPLWARENFLKGNRASMR